MNLRIKNFQSIADAELNFGPGINLIMGESGHGKSAILRAIKALLTNRQGREFIKQGALDTEITIDDVTWYKGKEIFYKTSESRFERLGANVPDEVYASLGFYPTQLEGMTIFLNISEQFDSPFLLVDSPSKIAKLFGSFSDVDAIYNAIGKCNKDVRSLQQQIAYGQTRIQEIEGELERFPDIPTLNDFLARFRLLLGLQDSRQSYVDISVPEIDLAHIVALRELISFRKSFIEIVDISMPAIASIYLLRNLLRLRLYYEDLPELSTISTVALGLLREYLVASGELKRIQEEVAVLQECNDLCPVCGRPLQEDDSYHG